MAEGYWQEYFFLKKRKPCPSWLSESCHICFGYCLPECSLASAWYMLTLVVLAAKHSWHWGSLTSFLRPLAPSGTKSDDYDEQASNKWTGVWCTLDFWGTKNECCIWCWPSVVDYGIRNKHRDAEDDWVEEGKCITPSWRFKKGNIHYLFAPHVVCAHSYPCFRCSYWCMCIVCLLFWSTVLCVHV